MASSDYFGTVREKEFDCPVIVIQGSAGNVTTQYFDSVNTSADARGEQYIRSHTALYDMTDAVYERIAPQIECLATTDGVFLKMYSEEPVLRSRVPTVEEAGRIASDAKNVCGIDGTAWAEEIDKRNKLGIEFEEEKAEVQYFSIGDFIISDVPN